MKCFKCGNDAEHDFRFCPNCGAPAEDPGLSAGQAVSADPGQNGRAARPAAYIRNDYDPSRDGHLRQAPAPGIVTPGQPAPAAALYRDPSAGPASPVVQRPPTTAQIVMASINIIGVGFGISFILGIIALVFTIIASSEQEVASARGKLQTAKTLNIIGLVFLIIQTLVIIGFVVAGIMMFAGVFGQPAGTFNGDFPLG